MNRPCLVLILFLGLCGCRTAPPISGFASSDLSGNGSIGTDKPYEKKLRWKDWSVGVRTLPVHTGEMVWYEVQVGRVSKGQEEPFHRTTYDADGEIQKTWLVDFKNTGRPILFLFTSRGGKAHYGSLRLLECREEGLRVLEGPNTARPLLEGYRGDDRWDWDQDSLVREFPIYKEGDDTGDPTGGHRVIRYRWEKGRWRVRFHNETGGMDATLSIP